MTDTEQKTNLHPGNFSISKYIWMLVVGFSSVLILIVSIIAYSLSTLEEFQHKLENVVDNHLEKVISIADMKDNARKRILTMLKMVHMDDPFDRDKSNALLDKYASEFTRSRMHLLTLDMDQSEKKLLSISDSLARKARPLQHAYSDLIMTDKIHLATDMLINTNAPIHDSVLDALEDIYNYQTDMAKQTAASTKNTYDTIFQQVLWLSIVAVFLTLAIIFIVISSTYKLASEKEAYLSDLKNINEAYSKSVDSLKLANKKAVVANSAKDTFLSNMSHEIRTPLTAIIGFAEDMLENGNLQKDNLKFTNIIARSGKHLLEIINEILDFSKIEAGKLDIEIVDTSLFALLDNLHTVLDFQAQKKDLYFEVNHVFPLPDTIPTDPTRLKQILLNLCNNSLKFTEKGGIKLNVSIDQKTEMLKFEVIDTGIGIKDQHMDHIFDAFSQEDSSTTRKFGGTGLGLSISRQLSKILGGTITASSQKNEGSVFTLTINIGDLSKLELLNEEPEIDYTAAHRKPVDNTHASLNARILLAEDNSDNQALIQLLINKTNCELDIASNGQAAFDMVLSKQYDLILMDMQMPVMNGAEATVLLRQTGFNLPIIALTANAQKKNIDHCYNIGCSGFISKPINRQDFFTELNKHLAKKIDPGKATKSERSAMDALKIKFIHSLPDSLQQLKNSIDDNNISSMKNILHIMKGNGGSLGLPQITQCALDLEIALQKKNENINLSELEPLENEIEALIVEG